MGRNPRPEADSLTRPPLPTPGRPALNAVYAAICLYFFLCAINVMGSGLKLVGKSTDRLEELLAHAHNPFIALMGSVLITAIVQSSSFTTALIITLVAADQLALNDAVFAVMGANIGTSVTNTIVSFGSVRIRRQFRRAFTAAIIHDVFNWLTVAILFPLEWISGALSQNGQGLLTRFAVWLTEIIGLEEIEKPNSPIKLITKPVVKAVNAAGEAIVSDAGIRGGVIAAVGLLLLFVSLAFMVKNLKGAVLRRIEGLFRRVFFRNDLTSCLIGALTTILVQSSSVTTSLIVPFAGAGAIKLKRVFPYTLGANLGTTITGVIAATANPVAAAVSVAVAHVTFNILGMAVWYPARRVPLTAARWYGRLAARSKRYAFFFLFGVFLVIPAIGILVTEMIIQLK